MVKYICPIDKQEFPTEEEYIKHMENEHGLRLDTIMTTAMIERLK